jgi:hypothetical protein
MDLEHDLLPNTNFVTELDIKEKSRNFLKLRHDGQPNREVITHETIGHTSFSAVLSRVQYGIYESKPACLVALDFSFRFRSKTLCRYSFATIEVDFMAAIDPKKPKLKSTNPSADPKVKNLAPKEVYGMVKTVGERKYWDISIPLMFESPVGAKVGMTGKGGMEKKAFEDNRAEIHGELLPDDSHPNGANAVTWDLTENEVQKDGIIRHFTGVVVVQHTEGQITWMNVCVKPSVKFSLDPRRLGQKTDPLLELFQRSDDPVLLDGKTPKEGQIDLGCDDFSSKDFPWEKILHIPTEYAVN